MRRNHVELAKTIAKDLPNNAEEALKYLVDQRHSLIEQKANMSGEMIRRLDFAIGNLAQVVDVNNLKDDKGPDIESDSSEIGIKF